MSSAQAVRTSFADVDLASDRVFRWIVGLALLYTLIGNISEVRGFFAGTLAGASQSTALTPIYIKVLKDLAMATILGLGYIRLARRGKFALDPAFLILAVTFLGSCFVTALSGQVLAVAVGMRWFLPVLLFPVFAAFADLRLQRLCARVMQLVLIVGLLLQVLQFLYAPPYYGADAQGHSLRNPGVYLIPSSMAMFASLTAYYAWNFEAHPMLRGFVVALFAPLSVLFTGSGSGLLAISGLYAVILLRRIRMISSLGLIIAIPAIIATFLAMPILTGRANIYRSLEMRLEIFADAIRWENLFTSSNVARGSNAASLLNSFVGSELVSAFVADSTITSLLVGVGLIGTIAFVVMLLRGLNLKTTLSMSFLATFMPFVLSVIAFEAHPLGLLLFLNLGYFYRVKYGDLSAARFSRAI